MHGPTRIFWSNLPTFSPAGIDAPVEGSAVYADKAQELKVTRMAQVKHTAGRRARDPPNPAPSARICSTRFLGAIGGRCIGTIGMVYPGTLFHRRQRGIPMHSYENRSEIRALLPFPQSAFACGAGVSCNMAGLHAWSGHVLSNGAATLVRTPPSWPRSWANSSLL
jgi:hypothetical protein